MKKYLNRITAAEESSAEDKLKTSVDVLDDDFSFIIAGIERISRNNIADGQAIADNLSLQLQTIIAEIADKLQEVE